MIEWLVVACTAALMSRVGYFLLSRLTGGDWLNSNDRKWVVYSCVVSVLTWSIVWIWIHRFTWNRSCMPWLYAGALSPILGCLVYFPATLFAFATLFENFHWFILVGVLTGLVMCFAVMASRKLTLRTSH